MKLAEQYIVGACWVRCVYVARIVPYARAICKEFSRLAAAHDLEKESGWTSSNRPEVMCRA